MLRSIPPGIRNKKPSSQRSSFGSWNKGSVYKKPKQQQHTTKPFFEGIKEPIIDVFKGAGEIHIIIDLGNFKKNELSFNLKNKKYSISGKHKDHKFEQEIHIPYVVDINKIKEDFSNNILKLVLLKNKRSKK